MAIVIQARMSSERLPGKMLTPIAGLTLLERVVARLEPVARQKGIPLWVATSEEKSDLPIFSACDELGISCFRGPLENVALRFLQLSQQEGFEFFLRVCGDSPLIHETVVMKAIDLFKVSNPTVVTNVFPRTFPRGQSVEVFDVAQFGSVYPEMNDVEREHLGKRFYDHVESHLVENFTSGKQFDESASMTVDTREDLNIMVQLFSHYGENGVQAMTWEELAAAVTDTRASQVRA